MVFKLAEGIGLGHLGRGVSVCLHDEELAPERLDLWKGEAGVEEEVEAA